MRDIVLYNEGKILEHGNTATLEGRLARVGSTRSPFFSAFLEFSFDLLL